MKKILTIALLATGLAVSAQAATTAGFEAGYLTDSKDAYLAARLGYEFKADTSASHQVELELGYTKDSETFAGAGGPVTAALKLMPLTVNYRAVFPGTGKLGYYLGGGIGVCQSRISVSGSGVPSISDSDSSLALQAFVGVNYKVSTNTTLNLGAKYLWFGEATLLGINDDVGDDLAIMAGVSFKF